MNTYLAEMPIVVERVNKKKIAAMSYPDNRVPDKLSLFTGCYIKYKSYENYIILMKTSQ